PLLKLTGLPGNAIQPHYPGTDLPAVLIDNPHPGEALREQQFITVAVARSGPNIGKILGAISWGLRTDGDGNWNPKLLIQPNLVNPPPADFFSAVKVWNGTPGKIQLPQFP